jgi:pimeloyl-ACP methyl ester carboxylesterase
MADTVSNNHSYSGAQVMKQFNFKHALATAAAATTLAASANPASAATPATSPSSSATITYHTTTVDGLKIFYREAGSPAAPTLLLLHGFPSSSRMFDTLIPLLADRYHLIAPDYPGFGQSDAPAASEFNYTFDHLANIIDQFTDQLGLQEYAMYMQDYGGPVGFRLALAHPKRIRAIVVQNAVSDEAGLGPAWDSRKAYWADRARYEDSVIPSFTSLETAKLRHIGTSPHPERYNPDTWLDEYAQLSRPGQRQIQSDLFYDYRNNVAAYPQWQAWMRKHQPRMLVLWGRYDPSFAVAGGPAYKRHVPQAEVHVLDAGHFALDEKLDDIAALIRDFLGRALPGAAM